MLDLTPLEAAEKLYKLLFFWKYTCKKDDGVLNYIKAMKLAISCLRSISAGEYKQVVHCEKCQNFDRKEGMWYDLDGFCERANKFVSKDFYCGFGALMDGKDDSHE